MSGLSMLMKQASFGSVSELRELSQDPGFG